MPAGGERRSTFLTLWSEGSLLTAARFAGIALAALNSRPEPPRRFRDQQNDTRRTRARSRPRACVARVQPDPVARRDSGRFADSNHSQLRSHTRHRNWSRPGNLLDHAGLRFEPLLDPADDAQRDAGISDDSDGPRGWI